VKYTQRIQSDFKWTLGKVATRKASRLLRLVGFSPRKVPELTAQWRDKQIDHLKSLIEEAYLPHLRGWVRKNTVRREVRFGSRFAKNDKALEVKQRLEARGCSHRHLVYVSFRGRKKCLKVGMSDRGLRRIASQWGQYFFRDASRVVVYFPKRKKRKILPALECALTHIFYPFHLYHWPSQRKYRERCRACRDMDNAKTLVKKIFPV
jgi:hypothetical protein